MKVRCLENVNLDCVPIDLPPLAIPIIRQEVRLQG